MMVYIVMKHGIDQEGNHYDAVDSVYLDALSADIRKSDILQETRHAGADDGVQSIECILDVYVKNFIVLPSIQLPF